MGRPKCDPTRVSQAEYEECLDEERAKRFEERTGSYAERLNAGLEAIDDEEDDD